MAASEEIANPGGNPDINPSGVGAFGGAVAGGALGAILGPVGVLAGGLLGLVIGDKYEQHHIKNNFHLTDDNIQERSGRVPEYVEYTQIKILEDIGDILGVDGRKYDLKEGDIVYLPESNAKVFLQKGAAKEINNSNSPNLDLDHDNIQIDLGRIQEIQVQERQMDSPVELPDSFYEQVGAYIEDLQTERNKLINELGEKTDSSEVAEVSTQIAELSKQIEKTQEITETIYERRVGKVSKMASLFTAGIPIERNKLTDIERDLLEDLTSRIERNQEEVSESNDVSASSSPQRENDNSVDEEESSDGLSILEQALSKREPEKESTENQESNPGEESEEDTKATGDM